MMNIFITVNLSFTVTMNQSRTSKFGQSEVVFLVPRSGKNRNKTERWICSFVREIIFRFRFNRVGPSSVGVIGVVVVGGVGDYSSLLLSAVIKERTGGKIFPNRYFSRFSGPLSKSVVVLKTAFSWLTEASNICKLVIL